jgi:hypothetical protein
MPSRPDLRALAANVKEAFGEMDRETLLEILTFVVKEYVVEGPPPMLVHQTETLADLQGLTFAQLIAALQTRFDHPELAMFAVDRDQVSVRVGGVMQPLLATRQPLAGPPAAELPRPAAGVRVVETTLQQRPPQPQSPQPQSPQTQPQPPQPQSATQPQRASAPPPARGVSVREAPSQGAQPSPPAQPAQGQPPAGQGQPAAPDKDKPEGSGDDAEARFSLLELD